MPTLIGQALAGLPLRIFETGKQSRCFCDLQDCVEALVRLLDTARAGGEAVNIGTDHKVSIENVAELMRKQTQSVESLWQH